MEETYDSLKDEEILYYPTRTNYGVSAKTKLSPKNIHISFSPHSSNQKISFINTIMFPSISFESPRIDTGKSQNKSISQNEKSKLYKIENTRINTESSREEKINMSIDKQFSKIMNESDIIDENTKEIHIKHKNSLELNPFFLGGNSEFDEAKLKKNNSAYENEKIERILKKNENRIDREEINYRVKTNKELRKAVIEKDKSNLKNKIKKIKTYNLTEVIKLANLEREDNDKIKKTKTSKTSKKKDSNNKMHKPRHSDKNIPIKNFDESLINRSRGNSQKMYSFRTKNKDNNIKLYKVSLFNKIGSKFNKNRTEEKDKYNKYKNSRIKYQGKSHNFLNMGFGIHSKEENKFDKIFNQQQENINTFRLKSKKKKSCNNIKRNKLALNLDFELALKNKNNLFNTQFNLFSPDKFTNTQFCGSDYLEYTLDCMDIILKINKSQKQQKNKINFNFPKHKGNKQKKIALFDLDETLVHCTGDINKNTEPYQHIIEVNLPGNKQTKVGINIRPLWKKTLNLIKKNYYIVVFTASHQEYADAVLNFMDPKNKYFKYRLYRNNCSLVDVEGNKFYVKDLDIFDEFYDLKDIIIIDNSVLSFIYHLENGIPIVPYYNEDKDGSLYVVGLYLNHIFQENDLREANKKYINLDTFLNEAKNRTESNGTIIEEPINVENNDIKKNEKDNININKKKPFIGIEEKTHRRYSYNIGYSQKKLMSQSKLINIYYEINNNQNLSENNIEEINEENSSKSMTNDEEQEIKEKKSNKKTADLFLEKRLYTSDDNLTRPSQGNLSKIKMIYSKFYNNFSEGVFLIK